MKQLSQGREDTQRFFIIPPINTRTNRWLKPRRSHDIAMKVFLIPISRSASLPIYQSTD